MDLLANRHKLNGTEFMKKYEHEIRQKLWYIYLDNENDPVMRAIDERAQKIASILDDTQYADAHRDKELDEAFKSKLNETINEPLLVDGKIVRRVRFVYSKLSADAIDRGLVETDKNMMGMFITKGAKKLELQRMDVNNYHQLQKQRGGMRIYLNEMVAFFNEKKLLHYGCLRSYVEKRGGSKMVALFNPRFPASPKQQTKLFSTGSQIKQVSIGSATGVIKVHLDMSGKVKSYEKFGLIPKELEQAFLKEAGYGGVEDDTDH